MTTGYDNPLITGDITDYPNSLYLGDTVFPLLYVYYLGTASNTKRVGNPDRYEQDLVRFYSKRAALTGGTMDAAALANRVKANRAKFYLMFRDAVMKKNTMWMWSFNNAVAALMSTYNNRIPVDPSRCYYGTSRSSASHVPILNPMDPKNLDNCMEGLRLMYENDIVGYDYDLGIRPVNLYDGSFADQEPEAEQRGGKARILGLPVKGQFILNSRPNVNNLYKTFTGIDIKAVASLNRTVTELDNITTLSWSLHAGRSATRLVGRAGAVGSRSYGSRTIAGSIVFALSDHHPLMRLLPEDFPTTKFGPNDRAIWRPNIMPDQIPPFDLMLVMQNEYGYASILALYGIQVVDDGGVVGVDNLITENVVQYTALGMDPLVQVEVGDNGEIDPYGLIQGGYAEIWKHREAMVSGVAYSNLEKAFSSYYDLSTNSWLNEKRRQQASSRERG